VTLIPNEGPKCFPSRIVARDKYCCYLITRTFQIEPLAIMSSIDELMSQQTYQISIISRTLANFKKLGKAKMTLVVISPRTSQRDFYQKSGIPLHADCWWKTEGNPCILHWRTISDVWEYFRRSHVVTWLRYWTAMNSLLLHLDGGNPSSRSSSHLPTINLPTYDGSLDK